MLFETVDHRAGLLARLSSRNGTAEHQAQRERRACRRVRALASKCVRSSFLGVVNRLIMTALAAKTIPMPLKSPGRWTLFRVGPSMEKARAFQRSCGDSN